MSFNLVSLGIVELSIVEGRTVGSVPLLYLHRGAAKERDEGKIRVF